MRIRYLLPTLFFCLLLASPISGAQPSAARTQADLVATLREQTDEQLDIAYHTETGKVCFIGTALNHPVLQTSVLPASASPA